jgi:hypothetical protein
MRSSINKTPSIIGTTFSKEAALIAKAEMLWNAQQWKNLTSSNIPPIFPSIDTETSTIFPTISPKPVQEKEEEKADN